ncbi:MAG TPA: SRPBCC family protein [Dictyobacter sp.]|jgi:hypothetical protein|nr:SRPBCC family protein [Dictyobacter sp.]
MVEHAASVIVKAPVHQVYELFTHFNDFPKFMSFVKEVTYYDDQRSHWVVQALRQYEWDAVNVDWIADKQIGWRSTRGLENTGKVKFRPLGPERTAVNVYIQYKPPTGSLGRLGERLGINEYFDTLLQQDLNNFARMVEEAPANALDPMSSHYLFHKDSAITRKIITSKQQLAMDHDPMMDPQALANRQKIINQEREKQQQQQTAMQEAYRQKRTREQQILRERQVMLEQAAIRRRQEQVAREEAIHQSEAQALHLNPRSRYATWARGLGDRDGTRTRVPDATRLTMSARRPPHTSITAPPIPPTEP